jgi:hypothetical protein
VASTIYQFLDLKGILRVHMTWRALSISPYHGVVGARQVLDLAQAELHLRGLEVTLTGSLARLL